MVPTTFPVLKQRFFHAIGVVGTLLILLLTTTLPSYAFTGTQPASVAQTCSVTRIVAHGTQPPTITCLRWENTRHPVPNTSNGVCGNNPVAEIWGDQGNVCFYGKGYLGYHMTHVYEYYFSLPISNQGWLKMYPSGYNNGFFYNYTGFGTVAYNVYPFDFQHDFTQICLQCGYHR